MHVLLNYWSPTVETGVSEQYQLSSRGAFSSRQALHRVHLSPRVGRHLKECCSISSTSCQQWARWRALWFC